MAEYNMLVSAFLFVFHVILQVTINMLCWFIAKDLGREKSEDSDVCLYDVGGLPTAIYLQVHVLSLYILLRCILRQDSHIVDLEQKATAATVDTSLGSKAR